MGEVEWPGRRCDVIEALRVLATATPETLRCWPGLTEAVHWLIDDTCWDFLSPAEVIGQILVDHHEVDKINAVLGPFLAVIDEVEPSSDDDDYLSHPRWPVIADGARAALDLLVG